MLDMPSLTGDLAELRSYLFRAVTQLNYELEDLSRRIAALENKEDK